jgi:cellulose synthase/poly-beta-1,6-N-acetylglucosamine synthase-like glycosyltransferase
MLNIETLFEILCLLLAFLVCIPLLILCLEALAALLPQRALPSESSHRARITVLLPAHNEEGGISATIAGIRKQLLPGDQLLVVADNCTDRTAELARSAGATVVERANPEQLGKGFALEYGVRCLEASPPEFVIIIDADCAIVEGGIDRLAREAATLGRPVQAAYLMEPSARPTVKERAAAFAFQFKNLIRPLGLKRLGFPCLLTGTGMALPWPLLRCAPLATGNLVEDMQLGLDFAVAGFPPHFCSQVLVTSGFPLQGSAILSQRTRWEQGHLRTLISQTPRLLWLSVRRQRIDLLGMALDLSVPPLSFLALLWALAGLGAALAWVGLGVRLPFFLLAGSGAAAFLALLAVWLRFGRCYLPFQSLLVVPFYVLWKVPIYIGFFLRPQRSWVRTERTSKAPFDATS